MENLLQSLREVKGIDGYAYDVVCGADDIEEAINNGKMEFTKELKTAIEKLIKNPTEDNAFVVCEAENNARLKGGK